MPRHTHADFYEATGTRLSISPRPPVMVPVCRWNEETDLLKRYDAILFDLDGTLWDASAASAGGWNTALTAAGHPELQVTSQDIRRVSGLPFRGAVEALLPELEEGRRSEVARLIDSGEQSSIQAKGGELYPDVIEGIHTLASRYRLFLVSNCQDWYLDLFWDSFPIRHLFRDSDCHGQSGCDKREMISRIVKRHRLENPIYVGDTRRDELAARAAGIDYSHAAYGFGDAGEPVHSFESFGQMVAHFMQ